MKPKFLIIVIVLFSLVLASCSQGPSSGVSISASSQKDQWFTAGRRTHIDITEMDPTVLYAVRTKSGRVRGISSRDANSSDSILTTEAGTHIPVPDENNSCNFVGSDVDISSSKDEIQLVELKAGTDFTLYASGEPDFITDEGERIWEEYYYVDLTQPPFDYTPEELKRMTLYGMPLGGSGSGSDDMAIVSTNFTAVVDEFSGTFGLIDLTGHDDVILYSKIGILSGSDWSRKLILKPTTIIGCDSSVVEIDDYFTTLQVNSSSAVPDIEYVLVINKYEDGVYQLEEWSSSMTRFTDGTSRAFAVPITTNEPDVTVIYLGTIESGRDFLIDFPIFNTDMTPKHYADVYIREINDYEKDMSGFTLSSTGKTIYTVDIPAGTRYKQPLMVSAEEGAFKNNLIITTECNYLNDDGTLGDYYCGYIDTYLNASHSYGVGYSGMAMYGPISKREIYDHFLLETISIEVIRFEDEERRSDRKLRLKITIEHSDEPLENDYYNWKGWEVLVIPNNGEKNYSVLVTTQEKYGNGTITAPSAPSRGGYSFIGWSLNGNMYSPGSQIRIDFTNTLVGVWEKQ